MVVYLPKGDKALVFWGNDGPGVYHGTRWYKPVYVQKLLTRDEVEFKD